jgi:lipopolysaccharide/colanic/teichoic acid biosynthesis glycosyltransferase
VERGSVPLVRIQRARLAGGHAFVKTVVERLLAGVALVLLAPLAALVVGRAWLAGCWPLLSCHWICGLGEERLGLWLFERQVTSWPPVRGLPALVAVLRGDLSLVGPRPAVWNARLTGAATSLTAVRPGLTGPWRLSGPAASLSEQAMQDLAYVREYTIWEDVRILGESLRCLASGQLASVLARWDEAGAPPRLHRSDAHAA